jgi:hypothetical protein
MSAHMVIAHHWAASVTSCDRRARVSAQTHPHKSNPSIDTSTITTRHEQQAEGGGGGGRRRERGAGKGAVVGFAVVGCYWMLMLEITGKRRRSANTHLKIKTYHVMKWTHERSNNSPPHTHAYTHIQPPPLRSRVESMSDGGAGLLEDMEARARAGSTTAKVRWAETGFKHHHHSVAVGSTQTAAHTPQCKRCLAFRSLERLEAFLFKLPKTDLHVHLDGSPRIETIIELAKEHGVTLPACACVFRLGWAGLGWAEWMDGWIIRSVHRFDRIANKFGAFDARLLLILPHNARLNPPPTPHHTNPRYGGGPAGDGVQGQLRLAQRVPLGLPPHRPSHAAKGVFGFGGGGAVV